MIFFIILTLLILYSIRASFFFPLDDIYREEEKDEAEEVVFTYPDPIIGKKLRVFHQQRLLKKGIIHKLTNPENFTQK